MSASVEDLEDLRRLVERDRVYVRYSEGPERDRDGASIDTESELALPGLSVNPLNPEPWWTRPVEDWLARQLCQYKHLREKNPQRRAWIVTGEEVGRGPDCEPLLADVQYIAALPDDALQEAENRYTTRFHAGRGPEDD